MRIYPKPRVQTLIIALLILSACLRNTDSGENNEAVKGEKIPANAIPILYTDFILLPGHVEGFPGSLLLDTGSENQCLDKYFHAKHPFSFKNYEAWSASGIGNTRPDIMVILDSVNFSFDNFSYRSPFVPILDLKPIGGDAIDGLIGTKYFQQQVLEINYSDHYIQLHDSISDLDLSDHSKVLLCKIKDYYCAPLLININDSIKIKGNFIIDTGTPVSLISSNIADKYDLQSSISQKVAYYTKYGGIGGESSGYDFFARSLTIADLELNKVIMTFSQDSGGVLSEDDYMGIIGNNVLDRFDLVFDFSDKSLYLKPNSSFNDEFIFDRLGFTYVDRYKTLGAWIVASLSENSLAERKGLQIDDSIFRVNDIPVQQIAYEDQEAFFDSLDYVKLSIKNGATLKDIEFKLFPLL